MRLTRSEFPPDRNRRALTVLSRCIRFAADLQSRLLSCLHRLRDTVYRTRIHLRGNRKYYPSASRIVSQRGAIEMTKPPGHDSPSESDSPDVDGRIPRVRVRRSISFRRPPRPASLRSRSSARCSPETNFLSLHRQTIATELEARRLFRRASVGRPFQSSRGASKTREQQYACPSGY